MTVYGAVGSVPVPPSFIQNQLFLQKLLAPFIGEDF